MQLSITIEADKDPCSLLLTMNEEKVFLMEDEEPMDIVLGAIARMHPFSSRSADVISPLRSLSSDGLSCPRAAVFPGAVEFVGRLDIFRPSGVPELRICMRDRLIDIPGHGTLSFDDFCGTPADRWENQKARPSRNSTHLFAYRYKPEDLEVHPTDLETGSLITGMFSNLAPGHWNTLTSDFVGLAGLLLGRRGDLFTDCVSGPVRAGHSGMREMRSNFQREGHVVSDRAWMPRKVLPGPRFDDCLAAARDDLVELGALLANQAEGLGPHTARRAIDKVLADTGEDPVQFSLRDTWLPEASNHEQLEVAGLIARLARTAGLDEKTLRPA